MTDRLINERAAAAHLGISRSAVRDMRERRVIRPAGYVRYRSAVYDVAYLDTILHSDVLVREGYARLIDAGDELVLLIYEDEED